MGDDVPSCLIHLTSQCRINQEHLSTCPVRQWEQCRRYFHAVCAGSPDRPNTCEQELLLATCRTLAVVGSSAITGDQNPQPNRTRRCRKTASAAAEQLRMEDTAELERDIASILNNTLAESSRVMYRGYMVRFIRFVFANDDDIGLITADMKADIA